MMDPEDEDTRRGDLPSDDELGPEDPDEDEDATAPGADADGAEAMDVDGGATERPPAVPEAPPAPSGDLSKLLVADLREHLLWRGVRPAGLKPALVELLQASLEKTVVTYEQYIAAGGTLGTAAAATAAAAAKKAPKFSWTKVDAARIDRPVYPGPDKFEPSPALGWTPSTHPFDFMQGFYPKSIRDLEVENSKRYRGWVKCNGKEVYEGYPDITPRTNSLAHAMLLLQGLSPLPDQRRMWSRSFAFKGHRGGDLMSREEWKLWKAYFHISHPGQAPSFGSKEWDELHKVRPLLDEFLRRCLANITDSRGRKFSIDEITIGFQGHHARLKQRCGKFKRAGDGFQADAIVLEGGYVLCLVFRGDNTTPVFSKTFSPLHNRCLLLLSKLVLNGHEGYWDNLYPSVDVAQKIAAGGEYTAAVPAGPKVGEQVTIKVPKTGTSGTARPNRLSGAPCLQPKKQGLSEKAIAEIKAKPLEQVSHPPTTRTTPCVATMTMGWRAWQRVKSAMTESEPRVICASVFDNGPVHMVDTIHTSAGIITIHKPRFDPKEKKIVKLPMRILALIDEYNHGMHHVDIRDHLAHSYNFDGSFWRDRKWWMPVFKELFKSACDQGYVCYKRVCEIAEGKRVKVVEAAKAEATKDAEAQAKRRKLSAEQTKAVVALALAGVADCPIKPISHLRFLEMIAEGFVIEAYNSTKGSGEMKLEAYSLDELERALSEMRGQAPPSEGARGAAAAAAPGTQPRGRAATPDQTTPQSGGNAEGKKRKAGHHVQAESDGLLPESVLSGEAHPLIDRQHAVALGLVTDQYSKKSNYCAYKWCPWAASNKKMKCGEESGRVQQPRAKAGGFCSHPSCRRFYHMTCFSIAHRLVCSCPAFRQVE